MRLAQAYTATLSYLQHILLIFSILLSMKRLLTWCLIFCLTLNNTIAYAAPISEQIYNLPPKCEEISEPQLRLDLNLVIEDFLKDKTDFSFEEVVNRQWQVLNLNSAIDSEIDSAVLTINDNAGLINKFQSSWVPSKAEELAHEVTEIAFNSPSLKEKLNLLSKNVSETLADKLEVISAKSSSYAVDCLQKFINRQYSQAFVDTFSDKIKVSNIDPDAIGSLKPDTIQYIDQHKFGAVGGTILITSITAKLRKKVVGTIVKRVFQQVSERVLSRIGSTFIPGIGDIIGLALLSTDIIKSFDGTLPIIQKSLKNLEIKQTIQKGIVSTIEKEIRTEIPQIAREISNDVYASWLDFQKDFRDTLSIAKELPEFKEILNESDLPKISLLVGIALNNMGRSQLIESIKDGAFDRVLSLPEVSYKIIENTHDLSSLVKWNNLAGNQIEEVVKLELYKNLSLKNLDRQLLLDILDLKDSSTISKITLLNTDSIHSLLSIPKNNLLSLSVHLSASDLERLAGYLKELKQPQRNQLVKFLINEDPSIIKNTSVMAHIVKSGNINAAIEFWDAQTNQFLIFDGIFKLLTGAISWELMADKLGIIPMTLLSALLIVLIVLPLILFYRWKQIIQPQKILLGESNAN
jgi:hypothetical protein